MENRSGPEEVLIKLFGSISRARILALLFDRQGQQLYQREIMYEIGFPLQPVQRELQNLVDLGIVKITRTRNRVYYEINRSSPFFKPLKEICGLPIG
ncbi:MAG: winged helix-turn-helix domain-containing protein [Thermodesulfobacteriota bacterium]|nr:winged helix-turn-helix domain-containing protein [Thermodesulfobacteriota bacterium]